MENLKTELASFAGAWAPLVLIASFVLSSWLILWRLEQVIQRGTGASVPGKLLMPYFSGLGNLIFVALMLLQDGPAEEVAINLWTNNLTNLCLLLAVPALLWGLSLHSGPRAKKTQRESKQEKLSLARTLVTMIVFSLAVWVVGQDGRISRLDGFALVGLFAVWQVFHLFEVLKEANRKQSGWQPMIALDVGLILVGSLVTLVAIDGTVSMILAQKDVFFNSDRLGLLTGWLMVLPNATLALYHGWKRHANLVYRSQVSDGHVSIPLCLGSFAIFKPMPLPDFFQNGLLFIASLACVHLLCVVFLRELPKLVALGLLAVYGYTLFIQLSL